MTALTSAGACEGAYARPFFSTARRPLTVGWDLLPPTTAPPLAWVPPLIGGLTPPDETADALGASCGGGGGGPGARGGPGGGSPPAPAPPGAPAPPRQSSMGMRPAAPIATSVWPLRQARPKLSLTITAGRAPRSSAIRVRSAR